MSLGTTERRAVLNDVTTRAVSVEVSCGDSVHNPAASGGCTVVTSSARYANRWKGLRFVSVRTQNPSQNRRAFVKPRVASCHAQTKNAFFYRGQYTRVHQSAPRKAHLKAAPAERTSSHPQVPQAFSKIRRKARKRVHPVPQKLPPPGKDAGYAAILPFHPTGAWSFQNSTLSMYFSRTSGTPDPPSSFPRALRIIVMGCIGIS